jgi:hypothetical protein
MQRLFCENAFGFARRCVCSDAVHLHFGNIALLLSHRHLYDFSAYITGTARDACTEDKDARCIYIPTRDLSLMFALSYNELLQLEEILSQTMMLIEIDKLLSNQ